MKDEKEVQTTIIIILQAGLVDLQGNSSKQWLWDRDIVAAWDRERTHSKKSNFPRFVISWFMSTRTPGSRKIPVFYDSLVHVHNVMIWCANNYAGHAGLLHRAASTSTCSTAVSALYIIVLVLVMRWWWHACVCTRGAWHVQCMHACSATKIIVDMMLHACSGLGTWARNTSFTICRIFLVFYKLSFWENRVRKSTLWLNRNCRRTLSSSQQVTSSTNSPRNCVCAAVDWIYCCGSYPQVTKMITDVQLGIFCNMTGVVLFLLVVLYHFVAANSQKTTTRKDEWVCLWLEVNMIGSVLFCSSSSTILWLPPANDCSMERWMSIPVTEVFCCFGERWMAYCAEQ